VTDADKPIDEALDKVLRAAGSRLDNYMVPETREAMREAMRDVMRAAWIEGCNVGWKTARGDL
jgi:hypothetical protein